VVNLPPTLQNLRPGWHRGRKLAEGLVQWGPLHEPDHFIDVRKLLAKSSSPSRRHWSTSAPASLVDAPPKRSTAAIVPPASGRSGRINTSPQRPDAEGQAFTRRQAPNQLRGHWGAMKAAISVVHKRENGGASFTCCESEAPQVQAGGCCLHLVGHPTQQPRPSRGENRIALGQFRR
jgi:hypothetical protein